MRKLWYLAALACIAATGDDPLTRPIAPEYAPRWLEPQQPVRIHGDSWLVGTVHMNVVLINTGAGLILIDAGLPQAAPLIETNIRAAGFDPADIRLILSSEPHYDHAGGIAALVRDSGARVVASRAGAIVLRAGHSGSEDPQRSALFAYPPVAQVRAADDGQRIKLGKVVVTAHATPGHTPGSMSWSWPSCERGECVQMVFASSLNPLTDGHYRYTDRANRAALAAFRRSFATLRNLRCDYLLTGHPEHSDGEAKLARLRTAPGSDPFRVPGACADLADRYERALDARLDEERRSLPSG